MSPDLAWMYAFAYLFVGGTMAQLNRVRGVYMPLRYVPLVVLLGPAMFAWHFVAELVRRLCRRP